jgi:hypothetical protein
MKLRRIRGIIFYHSGLGVQKTIFPIKDITLANSTHFSNLAHVLNEAQTGRIFSQGMEVRIISNKP